MTVELPTLGRLWTPDRRMLPCLRMWGPRMAEVSMPAWTGAPDAQPTTDAGANPPFDTWLRFEPPGAVCADGSQYKFFVRLSQTSDNVVIFLQGGGACWDYASCTGTGVRSAANKNGIIDDYANKHIEYSGFAIPVDYVYPLLSSRADVSPASDWNKVFLPYCTGDVYTGDTTVTYDDPSGVEPPIQFHHVGHRNIMAVITMLDDMFPQIPRMLVGGCSAGGAGAMSNYYFFRTGLNADKGYLINDSGPLFPDQEPTSRSLPLHDRVRAAWNLDPLLMGVPRSSELMQNMGLLPEVLASEFPNDRLSTTYFRLDYNYSLYSYERFYEVDAVGDIVVFGDGSGTSGLGLDEFDPVDRAAVYSLWWDDTSLLTAQFDGHPNLSYYLPFYRDTNDSHCVTIPGIEEFSQEEIVDIVLNDLPRFSWAGTDMLTATGTITAFDFAAHLLDDATPLGSFFETEGEGRFLSCTPDAYDAAMCAAAQ